MSAVRRRLTGVAVAAALALVSAPALAHPFGPPPRATIAAQGNSVFIDWLAAPDDAIAIGVHLGLLPPDTMDAYREGPAQVAPSARAEEVLSQSEELRGYLLQHVRVSQEGVRCDGTVKPVGNFVYDGARLTFRCPAPVAAVDLHISLLHDIHDAYRTFAVGAGGERQQAAFTLAQPGHRWDFAGAPAASSAGGWWPVLAVIALAIVLGAAVVWRRAGSRGG